MPTGPLFSYSAAPQPVKPKSKYRNVGEEAGLTLMSDPRVRRGLTIGSKTNQQPPEHSGPATKRTLKKTAKALGDNVNGQNDDTISQPSYSFVVPDFCGSEFNLDKYLVASDERKNNNQNESCQTDEFVPLPPPAEYVPRKTGVDTCTQVEDQRDLFNFDTAVKPMVEVITMKTIEQALYELSSEDELKNLQSEIDRFNVERESEATWILLKEKETIEDNKVKDKERADRVRIMATENGVRRTVASAAAMQQLMPSMVDCIFSDLFRDGVWKDDDREEAANTALPTVLQSAKHTTSMYSVAFDMVEELLLRAQDVHSELGEVEHIKRKDIHVHVTLSAKETGGEEAIFLGCFKLNPSSTVDSLEQEIQEKISEQKITIFSALQKPLLSYFGKFGAVKGEFQLLKLELPKRNEILI